jgi:hypothetical protein
MGDNGKLRTLFQKGTINRKTTNIDDACTLTSGGLRQSTMKHILNTLRAWVKQTRAPADERLLGSLDVLLEINANCSASVKVKPPTPSNVTANSTSGTASQSMSSSEHDFGDASGSP